MMQAIRAFAGRFIRHARSAPAIAHDSRSAMRHPNGLMALAGVVLALALPGQSHAARDVHDLPARSSPAWLRDGVVYEIFPRDFSAAGNLAGVTARLDDLQRLGVDILWLMPVHPVGQIEKKGSLGSPYAVRDYYGIAADYGTRDDLRQLVREAHRRGQKVLIDIVANHTAWDSVLMQHPDFYKHDAAGKIIAPQPDWADVAALNYDNPLLRAYMIAMLTDWLRDVDLDGFRCDAAGMVPTAFWEEARAALERVKPDIALLAEADDPELLVKAFDLDYSWQLHQALNDVLQGRAPASVLADTWTREGARWPRGALAGAAFVFALDGVPMLYNGMEVGDTGESADPALFEKLPIFWGNASLRPAFPAYFHDWIALRKTHPALRDGAVKWLKTSDAGRVAAFVRRDAAESVLVLVNLSSSPFDGTVDAPGDKRAEISPAVKGAAVAPAGRSQFALRAWEARVFLLQSNR
jgi:glycosidase